MDRAQKAQQISDISDRFARAKAAFLVDYKGMTVEQVTNLRKKLRPAEAEMRVVRNTLCRLAIKDLPDTDAAFNEHLVGTNAFVFAYGDVAAPAKELSEFGKVVEHLQLKAGVLEGKAMDKAGIEYLATLPSKEVLQAQLLGVLAGPARKFVQQLNAAPSSFVRLLAAYRDQKSE